MDLRKDLLILKEHNDILIRKIIVIKFNRLKIATRCFHSKNF